MLQVHYDRYDTKFKDSHDSLTWEAEEEAVQKFKHEFIYPNIIKGEIEGDSMSNWLEKLSIHSYEPSDDNSGEKDSDEKEIANNDDDDLNNDDDGFNNDDDGLNKDDDDPNNDEGRAPEGEFAKS